MSQIYIVVECKSCGDTMQVTKRTFELAHAVSDGQFTCDECLSDQ